MLFRSDLIAAGGGNYRGVALVGEETTDVELTTLDAGGVRAVRFHAIPHLAPMPGADFLKRLADRIRPLGWHILLHLMPDTLHLVDNFLGFGLPIVIDHMARMDPKGGVEQPQFKRLLHLVRDEGCWVKLGCADRVSRPPYKDTVPIARALLEAVPDRTIWSTDYPHVNHPAPPDDAELVDLLLDVAPDQGLRQKLLVDNPHKLYRFG